MLGKREGLSKVFKPFPISSYEDYKSLLSGESISHNIKLEPGDAIVLWSPLIDYFDGSSIDKSHLAKHDIFLKFKNHVLSDIVFFTENNWSNKSKVTKSFYESFIIAFALGISLRQRMIRNKRKLGLIDYLDESFYRRRAFGRIYRPAFKELFINNKYS